MAENPHFLNCVQYGIEVGHKYGPVDVMMLASGRNGVKKEIFDTVDSVQGDIKREIKSFSAYSLTSDIWSDSVNHNSFLDITIFYVKSNSDKIDHQIIAYK